MTPSQSRRALAGSSLAHLLHDGYTDMIYILLPLWQTEFGLGYTALAVLRGLYTSVAAGLQVPAGRWAETVGARRLLLIGTVIAAAGYALAGGSNGLIALSCSLVVAGIGSSTQHPLASAIVSQAYPKNSRGPLGTYNFAGDLGKVTLPGLTSLMLLHMLWHQALTLMAVLGILVTVFVAFLIPVMPTTHRDAGKVAAGSSRGGFGILMMLGIIDTGVRMGFLTFLPFLMLAKGANLAQNGLALTLVFVGGAAGKFACGWLGARFGLLATVVFTELGTALGILAVIFLPLNPTLLTLVPLGVMLNGTSSMLYGTVPELAPRGGVERAFAWFYTGTIGSGALSPIVYGAIGDLAGIRWGAASAALAAVLTCPFAFWLAPRLEESG